MSTGQKLIIAVLVAAVMVFASWGAVFAAVWSSGGLVTVAFDTPESPAFKVAVPMAVLEGALMATQSATEGEPFVELQAELGEWTPFVRELLEIVDDLPSATLVEVIEDDTHVRIAKRRGKLVVDVEDREVTVQIAMPVRPAVRTLRRILT